MNKVKIKNRSNSICFYKIPEKHIKKRFTPGEVKEIDKQELIELSYQPGGKELLKNNFLISDKEFAKELCPEIANEPEYWMEEEEIKNLMLNGNYDRFLDCLDFAPEGVIDTIKALAVSMPLNDNAKRDAIKAVTGFDVTRAIENKKAAEEDGAKEASTGKQRRVSTETTETVQPQTRRYRVLTEE